MKTSLIAAAVLLTTFAVRAQAPAAPAGNAAPVVDAVPAAVPTKDEPHHHLVLENSYVRVLHVEIPAQQATLLHAHALPYVSVAIGPLDFINAVSGKPEAHATLTDAQVGYSKGGFAHIVRTDAGTAFQNFTVELLKPQGAARNRCVKVIADLPVQDCPAGAAVTPVFETDEILVESETLEPQGKRVDVASDSPRLFLVLDKSELTIAIPALGDTKLHSADVFWLPAGAAPVLTNSGASVSRFLVLTFKDGGK
jgi:hypothetical protein